MKRNISILTAIILLLSAQAAFADLKIKVKQTVGGQSYENATYIKEKRQRSESMGGKMVNITQCDLRRAIQMNPAAKTFVVTEFGEIQTTGSDPINARTNAPVTKGGRIVTTVNVRDTGERKQMFGYTARHLVITMETESSPEACSKTDTKMEFDGWYIDFEAGFDCDQSFSPQAYSRGANGGCRDRYEMKTIGTARRGYPLYEKMTIFDGSGRESMSIVTEVVELSKGPLDAALFEVPADYRQVSDSSELYAVSASSASSVLGSTRPDATRSAASSSSLTAPGQAAAGPDQPLAEKAPGTIRIGIADVKTGAVGDGVAAADLAAAIEGALVQYLKVPNVEAVGLEAKLPSAIDAEAREKSCDFVLISSVSHKKGGGGFGKMFGSALGNAVSMTGLGHTGSTAGNIAGHVAAQSIISAASVSAQIKNKDELTLEVKLGPAGGVAILSRQFKSKSRSDGEDIISPLIEQAAQAIVDALGR